MLRNSTNIIEPPPVRSRPAPKRKSSKAFITFPTHIINGVQALDQGDSDQYNATLELTGSRRWKDVKLTIKHVNLVSGREQRTSVTVIPSVFQHSLSQAVLGARPKPFTNRFDHLAIHEMKNDHYLIQITACARPNMAWIYLTPAALATLRDAFLHVLQEMHHPTEKEPVETATTKKPAEGPIRQATAEPVGETPTKEQRFSFEKTDIKRGPGSSS